MNSVQIVIDEYAVAAKSSANVLVISEKGPLRLREIILAEEMAANFLISNIRVGRNSQVCSDGVIPASFFTEKDRQENLYFDVLPRGLQLTISVTNVRDEATLFKGSLSGDLASIVSEQSGVDFNRRKPSLDRFLLGLGYVTVPPKGRITVRTQPQVVFKPVSLVVPKAVLDGLRVTEVRVVGEDLLGNSDGLVAGQAKFRSSPTMQVADWLCIDVVNESDAPKPFCGTVIGMSPF